MHLKLWRRNSSIITILPTTTQLIYEARLPRIVLLDENPADAHVLQPAGKNIYVCRDLRNRLNRSSWRYGMFTTKRSWGKRTGIAAAELSPRLGRRRLRFCVPRTVLESWRGRLYTIYTKRLRTATDLTTLHLLVLILRHLQKC